MARITMKNTNLSVDKVLHGAKITYSWKNLTVQKPIDNAFIATEVQYNGYENPAFNLTFYIPQEAIQRVKDADEGFLSWADWHTLVKNKPTSDSVNILEIETGDDNNAFTSYAGAASVTSIPFVVKGYSLSFDIKDSSGATFWVVNAQLLETSN